MSILLIERMDENLTESKIIEEGNEKKYVIEGVFLQSNLKNGNGRIYPEQVMDNAVNVYTNRYLVNNRAVGELEHPYEGRPEGQGIWLPNVSHKITKLEKNGTDWIGRAEICKDTSSGAIVVGLMKAGVTLGTSSRASGSVKNSIVQNDFRIITPSDIVYEPSAPDAILTSIMENKEWIIEGGVLIERDMEEIQKQVNTDIRNKTFDEKALFQSLMNKVRQQS